MRLICGFSNDRSKTLFDNTTNYPNILKLPVNLDENGYGNSDEKRYLSSAATDFNTLYMFNNSIERIHFIALVIKTFRVFLSEIYKVSDYTPDTLNVMLKGGIILRVLLLDLIRDFDSETEDFITNEISKFTKLS